MHILAAPPFLPAWLVTKIQPPRLDAVFIVKGTFRLRPGSASVPETEPDFPTGDIPWDGDPERSLRYASDFVPFKPKTDLLFAGTCHVPGGRPATACTVKFGVGTWSKSLSVLGDRVWQHSLLQSSFTDPQPFVSMPIRYERAFGGPGYALNPVGTGASDDKVIRMPNIELPGQLITVRDANPPPAGFGPYPPTWPQRCGRLGTYDKKWLQERWPWLPADFDWSHFNSAPKDQQFPSPLRGDETLHFENLHPAHPRYESRLPAVRPRCFVEDKIGGGLRFREVPLVLDTLWADLDVEKLVLVWRGHVEAPSIKYKELEHLFVASEPQASQPLPAETYRRSFHEQLPRPFQFVPPTPTPEDEKEKAAYEAKLQEQEKLFSEVEAEAAKLRKQSEEAIRKTGVDPAPFVAPTGPPLNQAEILRQIQARFVEQMAAFRTSFPSAPDLASRFGTITPALPPDEPEEPGEAEAAPWTRESVQEAVRQGRDLSNQDFSGLDLSKLNLEGGRFAESRFTGCRLAGARLVRADLREAHLAGTDLTGADLTEAKLDGADFAKALLPGARLPGTTLRWTDFSGATLTGADFSRASGKTCSFSEANLTQGRFREASLPSADFSGASLAGADFTDAQLQDASIEGAKAAGIVAERADLSRLHASAGADCSGGNFRHSRAPDSAWSDSLLDRADFTQAVLPKADFEGASLREAVFVRADLRKARFPEAALAHARLQQCHLWQSSFERADLTLADFSGSNLYEAEFWQAQTKETKKLGANLKGTKLA